MRQSNLIKNVKNFRRSNLNVNIDQVAMNYASIITVEENQGELNSKAFGNYSGPID